MSLHIPPGWTIIMVIVTMNRQVDHQPRAASNLKVLYVLGAWSPDHSDAFHAKLR
jgi:hypothetical protein